MNCEVETSILSRVPCLGRSQPRERGYRTSTTSTAMGFPVQLRHGRLGKGLLTRRSLPRQPMGHGARRSQTWPLTWSKLRFGYLKQCVGVNGLPLSRVVGFNMWTLLQCVRNSSLGTETIHGKNTDGHRGTN